jgi:hypothetical protein
MASNWPRSATLLGEHGQLERTRGRGRSSRCRGLPPWRTMASRAPFDEAIDDEVVEATDDEREAAVRSGEMAFVHGGLTHGVSFCNGDAAPSAAGRGGI